MKTLKIEVIHDVVCSWCPIGYANLQQALSNLDIEAAIHFLPYELNPDMGSKGESIDAHLERRYQWNQSKLCDYRANLLAVAEQAGVCIDFSKRSHYYNSNKAHLLMHWCESYNKQQAMNALLIDAYFKRGLDISNTHVLLDLAEQLDLDRAQVEQALKSGGITQQLLMKKQRVLQLGINGVPAYIFNGNRLVTGSNSVEYFEQTIIGLTAKKTAQH
ncbi:MAG: DsbA family oxidoreductase [Pseudomonadales bacterium]